MTDLESAVKAIGAQNNVINDMMEAIDKQNTILKSVDNTLSKILTSQQDAAYKQESLSKRLLQDQKRKDSDYQTEQKDKKEDRDRDKKKEKKEVTLFDTLFDIAMGLGSLGAFFPALLGAGGLGGLIATLKDKIPNPFAQKPQPPVQGVPKPGAPGPITPETPAPGSPTTTPKPKGPVPTTGSGTGPALTPKGGSTPKAGTPPKTTPKGGSTPTATPKSPKVKPTPKVTTPKATPPKPPANAIRPGPRAAAPKAPANNVVPGPKIPKTRPVKPPSAGAGGFKFDFKSLMNPKNIMSGVKSLGIGLLLDWLAGLFIEELDKKLIKDMLEKYQALPENKKETYRERLEKILTEKKDYIEGKGPGGAALFWIDRTIKLGGETDAEKTFRTFEAVRQGIDVIDLNAAGTPPADAPPIQAKQVGGPITIPGSSIGDSYPMMLPPGAFVLNRTASEQFPFQTGGMVPTILEPGEKVFMPGTYGPEIPMLNDFIPRFQTGGEVPEPSEKGGKFEYPMPKGRTGTASYQVFGAPRDGGARRHAGVDLVETSPWGADPKLPIVAPRDGVVSQEKYTPSGYTAGLILNQTDGHDTRYVHMTPEVAPGTQVKAGDRIGKLIDLKDNSHLHFELYKSGSSAALNPSGYLSGAGKTPGAGGTIPGMQNMPDGEKGQESGGDGTVKDSVGKGGGNSPGGSMDWVGGDGKRDDGSGNKGNIVTNFFSSILGNKYVQKDSALSNYFSTLSTMVPGLGLLLGKSSNNTEGDKSNATNEGSNSNRTNQDPLTGGGGYQGDPGTLAVTGGVTQKGVDITKKIMQDGGATKQAAAAIAGNMAHESAGFIPGIREGGPFGKSSKPWPQGTVGKGYGWAQWTNAAPGDRYDKFIGSYGGDYNKIPSNADNYKFLMGELLTGNGGFIKKGRGTSGSWEEFKKKTNVSNATVDFRKTWERAGVAHDGPRIEYAKQFLSALPPETEKTTATSTPPEKKQTGGIVGTNTTNMMGSNTSKVMNNIKNMMGSNTSKINNMMGSNTSKVMNNTNNMMGSNTSKVMNEISNMVSQTVEKKQTGGMVGNKTKYMSNASNKSQEFRQANMKQMSQSAQSGSPIVIMNNNSQQSAPVMMPPGDAYVPSLPDAPSNDIWKSYINFAQRMSIG